MGQALPVIDPPANTSAWSAKLALGFTAQQGKTLLSERYRHGPLSVQRPFYPEGGCCHVYVLHPPGGVVGGDHLAIEINAQTNSHALITTPGATKFYRSQGQTAHQEQHLHVAEHSLLEWLPQETILFPGAKVSLNNTIQLSGNAKYIGWEILSLGRPVIQERFDEGTVMLKMRLYRDQRVQFADTLRISPSSVDLHSGIASHPIVGTLIATPLSDCSALKQQIQALCTKTEQGIAGITQIRDVLVLRYLGQCSAEAQNLFRAVWELLRPHIQQHQACAPRIWAT